MKLVTLRDGYAEAPFPAVVTTVVALRSLWDAGKQLILYDALEHARTGEKQFNADHLESLGLTSGGVMHDITKHTILSMVAFDPATLTITISNPVAPS